jgi:hypothetical protein
MSLTFSKNSQHRLENALLYIYVVHTRFLLDLPQGYKTAQILIGIPLIFSIYYK